MDESQGSSSSKREYGLVHGMSISSIVEDSLNTSRMQSKYKRLRKFGPEAADSSSTTSSGDSAPPSSPASPAALRCGTTSDSSSGSDSRPLQQHGRSIVEKQRRLRKQEKTKRRKRLGPTTVLFKRRSERKEAASPALLELRRRLVMEMVESDCSDDDVEDGDCRSEEDGENVAPIFGRGGGTRRPEMDRELLQLIGDGENKENIDLKEFQEKMRL